MVWPWDRRNEPAQMDRAGELPLFPLDSPKRSPDVGLWISSSDLKNRSDLGVQVTHLGEGLSKGDATKPTTVLDLPSPLSEVGGQSPPKRVNGRIQSKEFLRRGAEGVPDLKKTYASILRYLIRCGWSASAPMRRLRSFS